KYRSRFNMIIFVKRGQWAAKQTISEALGPELIPNARIAVCGSGGKTSIIMRLAEEQKMFGKKTLIFTTTRMYKPAKYGVLTGRADEIKNALTKNNIVIAGIEATDGKIAWPGDALYRLCAPWADLVLIEADGSKKLPVKFPNNAEPVIPPDTDIILAVTGLSAAGKPGTLFCHRWELAKKVLGDQKETLRSEDICLLLSEGYLKPLRNKKVIPVINQADNEDLQKTGKEMIDRLGADPGVVMSNGVIS
ncbi:MAG: selenium cofactor biosynthesis protein YqeC, partial [Bacillota bacterium]|nr:selenium cofactor biosynthesis protein YqeC [Bacillota bacterium]